MGKLIHEIYFITYSNKQNADIYYPLYQLKVVSIIKNVWLIHCLKGIPFARGMKNLGENQGLEASSGQENRPIMSLREKLGSRT